MLIQAKTVDLDYVASLPEAKRVPLPSILTHTEFADCPFFREQLRFVRNQLEAYLSTVITYRDLARVFNCHVGSIEYQMARLKGPIRPIGRPRLLTPEAYLMVARLVTDAYNRRAPVSILYLIEQIEYFFDVSVSQNTMAHILRNMPDVKLVTGVPMDKHRVMADPHAINDFYTNIRTLLMGIPRAFVVNMDESGFADYSDARRETVVVPADFADDTIPVPVDCNAKRATLVAGIAANGSGMTPLILVPRKTIDAELIVCGYDEEKVAFHYQGNGFLTITLFQKWISEVLIPYFRALRKRIGYHEPAMVILDGCTCHAIDRFQDRLRLKSIILVPLL
jgi:hypothetical protein